MRWRDEIWARLGQPWDIIVIGGGITGAGIAREAARAGARVLLLEQRDWAWGTSSRSSKLVHGGLRYLAQGDIRLTRDSVVERERLLAAAPGLVTPLNFLLAPRKDRRDQRWMYRAGLAIYDLLAGRWQHEALSPAQVHALAPHLDEGVTGAGLRYGDAQTDDARLVLRLLREAVAAGVTALNYAAVSGLLREDGDVAGVTVDDLVGGRSAALRAGAVVNATGAWVDRLRAQVDAPARMRPLRGSHLMFAAWRLPVAQAINIAHPLDGRPVFALPWEGATLVGTTDLDHTGDLAGEATISPDEVAYLMTALAAYFPALGLGLDDIVSTWSGVRPVVASGAADPSKESRDHVVWQERGLLTVTGGKLTTFRLIALDALRTLSDRIPALAALDERAPAFDPAPADLVAPLDAGARQRLLGRYGADAAALVAAAPAAELAPIGPTPALWAELRWAARTEQVVRLDDLLLRRTRIGLLLPRGAAECIDQIRAICQAELGWDDARWDEEAGRYRAIIAGHYSVPAGVPDWRPALSQAVAAADRRRSARRRQSKAVLASALAALGFWGGWRRAQGAAREQ
ncbi:MAG TPA: glycerol-3-phosphate dehydrogenase/oxidase [Herpetosiphonaceae bacterium]|nr:glycerol-3-phosphate dehydrogenase/oxidase [Herpetosiphonaceae bacterium]